MNITFPTITFPHRGQDEKSIFVSKQETAQDKLAGDLTTALEELVTQATELQQDVTTKHDTVVEKEALISEHYEAIDTVATNISKVDTVATDISKVDTVATDIIKVKTVAENITNVNTVAENISTITSKIGISDIHNATSKTTPAGADEFSVLDSEDTVNPFSLKKLTWANIKATLKTYFDGLPAPVFSSITDLKLVNQAYFFNASNFNGIEYADSGLKGVPDTTFSSTGARIYPDGSIRGKSSFGEYVKYPDGILICNTAYVAGISGGTLGQFVPNMYSYELNLTLPALSVTYPLGYSGHSIDSYYHGLVHNAINGIFRYETKSLNPASTDIHIIWIGRWK